MTRILFWSVLFSMLSIASGTVRSDEPTSVSDADRQIRETVKDYVAAFNRGDAKAVGSFWVEQAEYIVPDGSKVVGREAIEQMFSKLFAENKDLQLAVERPLIRLEGAAEAVEQGVAIVSHQGEVSEVTRYIATHVKEGDAWKLKRVQEAKTRVAPSHYEQLKGLDWLAGRWVDQDEESTVATTCQWSRNGNYLTRIFAVSSSDEIDLEGLQVIAFDPSEDQIRSWVFDSDGGIGEGRWTQEGNRWTIQSTHVLPDGSKGKATRVMTRVDDDTFTLESVNREVEGESLPDIDAVKVVRKK